MEVVVVVVAGVAGSGGSGSGRVVIAVVRVVIVVVEFVVVAFVKHHQISHRPKKILHFARLVVTLPASSASATRARRLQRWLRPWPLRTGWMVLWLVG